MDFRDLYVPYPSFVVLCVDVLWLVACGFFLVLFSSILSILSIFVVE
jgi:hypothetical protein